MKLNLGRDSEARFGQDVDAVMKLNLGRDSQARFGQDFEF